MFDRQRIIGFVLFLLLLPSLAYLPGLSGPYVFDDYSNLLENDYVKLKSLNPDELYRSAFSLKAGPTHRPVAMVSMGINHYFAGGFENVLPFKLTNLVIHLINGLLIFWLIYLVIRRLQKVSPEISSWPEFGNQAAVLMSGFTALLWATNPIQLTTVLYIVQRMTSMAALFTFLALICFLKGRERMVEKKARGALLAGLGTLFSGSLGILSKENAVLLIPLILLCELTLFRNETPLRRWHALSRHTKKTLIGILLVAISIAFGWAINHAASGYSTRDFSMGERLLTETRVLWLYAFLTLIPRVDLMGLNHDDIVLSSSLIQPWTTLPSLLGIVAMIVAAGLCWTRRPLMAFGILWFLIGHALESSIFDLEIAHEHRQYLPSVGILLTAVDLLGLISARLEIRRLWMLLPLMILVFCGTTFLRSQTWSDFNTLAIFEEMHHPNSPRAQVYLGTSLFRQGNYEPAMEAMRRGAQLDRQDAMYYLNVFQISAYSGIPVSAEEKQKTLQMLRTQKPTASLTASLQNIHGCLPERCGKLAPDMESWVNALLANPSANIDPSFLYFLLGRSLFIQGRTGEALAALKHSYTEDPSYLHPRFEEVYILMKTKRLKEAKNAVASLREASGKSLFPRSAEIDELEKQLAALSH